jgi:ABC-type transporter Mla MlaB component
LFPFGAEIAVICVLKGIMMLKISVLDLPAKRTLVLSGTLIAPWAAELSSTWKWARVCADDQQMVVDLKGITTISREGENVLLELMEDGAKFVSDGVQTKYILRQLAHRRKKQTGLQPSTLKPGNEACRGQK